MPTSDLAKDTILVIDDEDDVRRILAKLLEREGFHTLQARDGSEAIHIFAEHAGEIAAVTLDLTMPTTNGHEALKMLSEYDPRLPIVVATALPLPNNLMGRVPGTRGVGYIQKPFSSSALAQELRRVIAEMQGD